MPGAAYTSLGTIINEPADEKSECFPEIQKRQKDAKLLKEFAENYIQSLKNLLQQAFPDFGGSDNLIKEFINCPFGPFMKGSFQDLLRLMLSKKNLDEIKIQNPQGLFGCSLTTLECLFGHLTDHLTEQQEIAMDWGFRGNVVGLALHFYTNSNDPLRSFFTEFIKEHHRISVFQLSKVLPRFNI